MEDHLQVVLRCKKQERAIALHRSRMLDGEGIYSYELRWTDPKFAGCRAFLVAHWKALFDLMMERTPDQRRYYEMIREGVPCKLYFDLEFSKSLNDDLDGDALTMKFVQFVCSQLSLLARTDIAYEDVLILKSDSAKKYSAHLIFNSDEVCFRNNLVCKSFIEHLMASEGSHEFFVNTEQNKKSSFCDMSVYSKNRNFRLYKNTKYKKNSFLTVAEIDRYVKSRDLVNDEDIFYHSLICLDNIDNRRILSEDSLATTEKVLCQKAEPQSDICDDLADLLGHINIAPRITEKDRKIVLQAPTPFRQLDKLITGLVAPYGGRVEKVVHYRDTSVLLYSFIGYNFCKNRGRSHRSNKVYFHVDLTLPGYAQKCFDIQDCYGYMSAFEAIPNDVAEASLQTLKELQSGDQQETDNHASLAEISDHSATVPAQRRSAENETDGK